MHARLGALLAALAFGVPVLAQTQGQIAKPDVATTKLWKIETSGLGGWGAASQAARVSSILEKNPNLKNLVFDTTGIGYFEPGKQVPEVADLNLLLSEKRVKDVKVTALKEVDIPKEDAIYELQISGLGWMGTAIETRDVLSKIDGVIRVHPNGVNGKALVYVKDKKTFTQNIAKEALLATKELRLRKMQIAKA